jgi:hypothetical protein
MHFDELDFIDHACLDFIAGFQERHQETGGSVIMEWRSLIGRYTRGGIRAAARRTMPPPVPRVPEDSGNRPRSRATAAADSSRS